MNVKQLVKRAKKGNKEAIVQLIMAQQHDFYRLAYTYVQNEHDALDALENMIVILYNKIDQLQNAEAFYSWSKTILVNECRAILRHKKRIIFIEDEQLPELTETPYDDIKRLHDLHIAHSINRDELIIRSSL